MPTGTSIWSWVTHGDASLHIYRYYARVYALIPEKRHHASPEQVLDLGGNVGTVGTRPSRTFLPGRG